MIILDKPTTLMFIEPKSKNTTETNDEITAFVAVAAQKMKGRGDLTKGFHMCVCRECSDNQTYTVRIGGKNFTTNSLLLHYVQFHRDEIPASELEKITQNMN